MTTSFESVVILTINIWILKKPSKSTSIHFKNIVIRFTYKLLFSVSKSSRMSDYRSTKTAAKSGTSTESDSKSRIRKSEILRKQCVVDGILSSVSLKKVVDSPSGQPSDQQGTENVRIAVLGRDLVKSQDGQN